MLGRRVRAGKGDEARSWEDWEGCGGCDAIVAVEEIDEYCETLVLRLLA